MLKIYIWGTGAIATKILENDLPVNILGYIETQKTKEWFNGKRVYQYTEKLEKYDAIIVANRYSDEVLESAMGQNMDVRKFIFLTPYIHVETEKKIKWIKEILGEKNFELYCCRHGLYSNTFYARDKELYNSLNERESFKVDENDIYPITKDKFTQAGNVSPYFWQDLWAASLIYKNQPKEHYDIGSRIDGFIAHVLSYGVPVKMIDIRPFPIKIDGLTTVIGDATNMEQFEDGSIESLSALCSLEHFGLGRYGDPIDPEACFKCFASIQNKMKTGGKLYLSVPIGKERLQFNAHRIFYARTIIESFNKVRLLEFSCTANGKIEKNIEINRYDDDMESKGNRFGLFYFEKVL